ncbi:hypothetical protein BYT27DRAFT_7213282 [Phlegmacium glaucopus]|nr:hypothetical protein BYT27DRAFT_7213282 [Phlegmacium glaucopus]
MKGTSPNIPRQASPPQIAKLSSRDPSPLLVPVRDDQELQELCTEEVRVRDARQADYANSCDTSKNVALNRNLSSPGFKPNPWRAHWQQLEMIAWKLQERGKRCETRSKKRIKSIVNGYPICNKDSATVEKLEGLFA